MEKDNSKIITLAFLIFGAVSAIVIKVILNALSVGVGVIARFNNSDWFRHGIPTAAFLITFFALQLNKTSRTVADEAVLELQKVVWPSKKDTTGMTIVCCVMVLMASVVLGVFDFLSNSLMGMFVH